MSPTCYDLYDLIVIALSISNPNSDPTYSLTLSTVDLLYVCAAADARAGAAAAAPRGGRTTPQAGRQQRLGLGR